MKTMLGWCTAAALVCLQCVNATAQESPLSRAAAAAAAETLQRANATTQPSPQQFAEPVRLKAGDVFMGEKRLYPSPVIHDVNGDGVPDVVVGDLRGLMTVALGKRTGAGIRFGEEKPILDHEGKDLKFHNW